MGLGTSGVYSGMWEVTSMCELGLLQEHAFMVKLCYIWVSVQRLA